MVWYYNVDLLILILNCSVSNQLLTISRTRTVAGIAFSDILRMTPISTEQAGYFSKHSANKLEDKFNGSVRRNGNY
jgi:hypothetical protein